MKFINCDKLGVFRSLRQLNGGVDNERMFGGKCELIVLNCAFQHLELNKI
jgi:hypothetical protein